MCWAFDLTPSVAMQQQWDIIWYDVLFKIKMKLNTFSTNHLQIYYSLTEVVGALFGGKKDAKKPINVNDMSPEAAVASLNELFKSAGGG